MSKCHKISDRSHSRYCRRVNDLPYSNLSVQLQILVRKWFCDNSKCASRVFTERLSWLKPYQRRTARLEQVIEKITLSTNCLTAEKVCKALHIRVSHDTGSNGPVEGHVNRLKTIKRMMYGRAGFDVLRNRFLYQ